MDIRSSDPKEAAVNDIAKDKMKGNIPGLKGMTDSDEERGDDDTTSEDGRGAKNRGLRQSTEMMAG